MKNWPKVQLMKSTTMLNENNIFHINVGTVNKIDGDNRHWTLKWCNENFKKDEWRFDVVYSVSDGDMIVLIFDHIADAVAAKMRFSDMIPPKDMSFLKYKN